MMVDEVNSAALAGVRRLAAFSDGDSGGNPAGVLISEEMHPDSVMQRVAAAVGYSETAFLVEQGPVWRTRYFSPESEVPFCGHATIALGAALAQEKGAGTFTLELNAGQIIVESRRDGSLYRSRLRSLPSSQSKLAKDVLDGALSLFQLDAGDLDSALPTAIARAGATHLILPLKSRETLAGMRYDLADGRRFMNEHGLITIALMVAEGDATFSARNAFASGGVLEDPATGAAAAAFGGYLRDLVGNAPPRITIRQGADMGMPSLIEVEIPAEPGSPLFVSGTVRSLA